MSTASASASPTLDWAALIDREKDMIKDIPDYLAETLAGTRRRADPRATPNSSAPTRSSVGGRELEAKHIVIATGSKPRPLPIPGAELMITSDEC